MARLASSLPPLALVLLITSAWGTGAPYTRSQGPLSPSDSTNPDSGYTGDTTGYYESARPDTTYQDSVVHSGWLWRNVPGARCRDGSPTGFAVRPAPAGASHSAKRTTIIFLQGGGAAYDWATAYATPLSAGPAEVAAWIDIHGGKGILASRSDNPLNNANVVLVPYCTGDIHGGSNPWGVVERHPIQRMVGGDNLRLILDAAKPLFADSRRVVLVGKSAGGFGVLTQWAATNHALAPLQVDAIADCSAITTDAAVMTPWLQRRWRALYHLAEPDGCGPECRQDDGSGLPHFVAAQANAMPSRVLGLITSSHDAVIRSFLGHSEECAFDCDTDSTAFEAGHYALRSVLPQNVGQFVYPDSRHCILTDASFYTTTSTDGVLLTDWIKSLYVGNAYHTPTDQ